MGGGKTNHLGRIVDLGLSFLQVGHIYDRYCALSSTTAQGSGSTGPGLDSLTMSFSQNLQEAGSTAAPNGSTSPVFIFSRRGSTGSTGPLPAHYRLVLSEYRERKLSDQ
jgi:hypothetical protein